jgi:hypothetical protein
MGSAASAWILTLALGLMAGTFAWAVGEFTLDTFKPDPKVAAEPYKFDLLNKQIGKANALNGAVAFGALGALLGLALGIAGGLTGGSAGRAAAGAIVGLVLGAAAGALPSFALMPYQWSHRNDDPSSTLLMGPFLIHLGLWSGLGLAAGFAFGLGRSGLRPPRLIEAALAGLAGAMLGTFVFEMVGALLLPLAKTAYPIAETSGARLLARECVAVFVALGAIRTLPHRSESDSVAKFHVESRESGLQ